MAKSKNKAADKGPRAVGLRATGRGRVSDKEVRLEPRHAACRRWQRPWLMSREMRGLRCCEDEGGRSQRRGSGLMVGASGCCGFTGEGRVGWRSGWWC